MRQPLTRQNSTRVKRRYSAYQNRIFVYLVTLVTAPLLLLGVLIIAHEGGHFWAARACGINLKKYVILAYALSGLFIGLAGVLYTSRANCGVATGAQGYERHVR